MPDDPLALATRRRLYDVVVGTPGVSAREAQRIAGTAWGETTYHLLRLEEAGHILRERGAHQDFFFARAVPVGARSLLRQARSPAVRRILVALLEEPGLTLDELAARIGASAPRTSIHLRRLLDSRVVGVGRRGRLRSFAIADRVGVGQILVRYRFGYADASVDRLVELWAEIFPP